MKTNTSKKILFLIVLFAVLLYGNFFLFSKIYIEYNYIINTKKTIALESTKTNSIGETRNKINELNKINDRINKILINESNAVEFISLMEKISADSESKIQIASVDFKDVADEKEFGVLNMKFNVSGSWSQVNNFLNDVEYLHYLINIDSARFSVSNVNEDTEPLWSADFVLVGLTN